jgi:hypothetical protein
VVQTKAEIEPVKKPVSNDAAGLEFLAKLGPRAEADIYPAESNFVQHKQSTHDPFSVFGLTWSCVGNSGSSARPPFGRMRVTKVKYGDSDQLEIPE